ncbi:MAG: Gfo/Idh/MocA family oxidoreductase [Clostridiales bacterium]|nr:Gfo/Idh/MocA family oxidoreductase [Clostridiales bacterium]
MPIFRFAIMGAGKIARKFCDAVALTEGCCVCAVASKSMDRARALASEKGIPAAYDSYEQMLEQEKPDCVYISATCDAHYALSMLCAEHGVSVLCEKAMFTCLSDAERFFSFAEEKGIFSMEALWSRFLPAVRTARKWVSDGEIGIPVAAEMGIGFAAKNDPDNRYFSPRLGGGAANDLTVYGIQLLTWVLDRPITRASAEVIPAFTGVDATSMVLMLLGDDVPALVRSSLLANVDQQLVVYGTDGKIMIPRPHFGAEAFLIKPDETHNVHFRDETTVNGFTYEIEETMRCVNSGFTESPVVPHSSTLACCRVFDLISARLNKGQ